MADRSPIVLATGDQQELQSGDSLVATTQPPELNNLEYVTLLQLNNLTDEQTTAVTETLAIPSIFTVVEQTASGITTSFSGFAANHYQQLHWQQRDKPDHQWGRKSNHQEAGNF